MTYKHTWAEKFIQGVRRFYGTVQTMWAAAQGTQPFGGRGKHHKIPKSLARRVKYIFGHIVF